jgi:hypothetical protein
MMDLFDAHCHLHVRHAPSLYHALVMFAADAVSAGAVQPYDTRHQLQSPPGIRCMVLSVQDPRIGGRIGEVLAAAHAAGVRRFSVNGTCEDDWHKVCTVTLPAVSALLLLVYPMTTGPKMRAPAMRCLDVSEVYTSCSYQLQMCWFGALL